MTILDLIREAARHFCLETVAVRLFLTTGRELCNSAHTLHEEFIQSNSVVHVILRPVCGQDASPPCEARGNSAQFPSFLISYHYFDQLLQLCQHEECNENVWRLLLRIPTNKSMRNLFRQLTIPGVGTGWQSQLQCGHMFRLCYNLQICESLAWPSPACSDTEQGTANSFNESWLANFLEQGGFTQVFTLLTDVRMVLCTGDLEEYGALQCTVHKSCQWIAMKLAHKMLEYMQQLRIKDDVRAKRVVEVLASVEYSKLKLQAATMVTASALHSRSHEDTMVVLWGMKLISVCSVRLFTIRHEIILHGFSYFP